MTVDLDKMTLKQKLALAVKLDESIRESKNAEKQKIRTRAEKMAREAGFALADVMSEPRKPRKQHKKKPRIYNPEDKTQSYGGYGPKPDWLKAIEARA